ncbi:MAG: biopolymer transporter ExbD [Myxococcota bacterium]
MRIALATAAFLIISCSGREGDPDEQQLARMNRELALLTERIDALDRRVADFERQDSRATGDQTGEATDDGKRADQAQASPLVVAVGRDGGFAIAGTPVDETQLAQRLAAHRTAGSEAALHIQASEQAPSQAVITLIDLARAAGFTSFVQLQP